MGKFKAMTALGAHEPRTVTIGPLVVMERFDVALASVAARRSRMADVGKAASVLGLPLPEAGRYRAAKVWSAFWVAPEMWFVEADFAAHELIAEELSAALGEAASVTEQTDAWVAFDLAALDLTPLMERLTNVDFAKAEDCFATRTVIDHLGCYLVKHAAGRVRLYGPRSSAQSLLHTVEVAALSVW